MSMYCQPEEVRQFLADPTISTTTLLALIPGVCEGIDGWCHRSFTPVTKTRLYDYTDSRTVKLREDLVSISVVTTNAGQTFSDADFILEPGDNPPYRWIKLKYGKSFLYSGTREQAISITGSWGYQAEVPDSVILAVKIWTGILYNQLDAIGFSSLSGGELSAKLKELTNEPPADVQVHINRYRAIRIRSARVL